MSLVALVYAGITDARGPEPGTQVVHAMPNPQAVVNLGPSKDNTLIEDATGGLSNGAGENLFAGKTGNGSIRRGLIAFSLEHNGIPTESTVTSVSLTLHMSRTSAGPQTVELHRLTTDWGEGDSSSQGGAGAPATSDDATWLHAFFDYATWTSPGGDFLLRPSAAISVGDVGSYTWSSDQMAADVQEWLDNPPGNFGWLLLGNEAQNQTTKRFDSKENTDPADRPVLNIRFTPPEDSVTTPAAGGAAVSGAALLALAAAGFVLVLGGGLLRASRRYRT